MVSPSIRPFGLRLGRVVTCRPRNLVEHCPEPERRSRELASRNREPLESRACLDKPSRPHPEEPNCHPQNGPPIATGQVLEDRLRPTGWLKAIELADLTDDRADFGPPIPMRHEVDELTKNWKVERRKNPMSGCDFGPSNLKRFVKPSLDTEVRRVHTRATG